MSGEYHPIQRRAFVGTDSLGKLRPFSKGGLRTAVTGCDGVVEKRPALVQSAFGNGVFKDGGGGRVFADILLRQADGV